MSTGNSSARCGLSIFTALMVVIIGFKATGHLQVAWVWVLAPVWMPIITISIIVVMGVLIYSFSMVLLNLLDKYR